MERVDVVIIGGGLAGLTAANYLAKGGKSVVVFEKSNRLGGRSITNHSNGVLFNIGAHALYTNGEAMDVFKELDIRISGGNPSVQAHGIWKNKVYPIPTGFGSLLSSPLLTWTEKVQFAQLIMKIMNLNIDQMPVLSLKDWAELQIKSPMIRHLFYALSRTTTFTNAPSLQLSGPVIRQLQRAMKKNAVLYVDDGWESIINELRSKASHLGVKTFCRSKVVKLEQNGQLQKVHTSDNELFVADYIILAIPPEEAYRLLECASVYQWKKQAVPITATCLDLGLNHLPNPTNQFVLGLDQPILFTNESRAANLTSAGGVVVHLIKYHDPTDQDYDPQVNKNQLEQAMDLLHPGWRNEIITQQFLPHITVVHDFPHMNRQGFPGPEIPEFNDIYVAGDWAGNEELLSDAAVASGKRAAKHILEKMKVLI